MCASVMSMTLSIRAPAQIGRAFGAFGDSLTGNPSTEGSNNLAGMERQDSVPGMPEVRVLELELE